MSQPSLADGNPASSQYKILAQVQGSIGGVPTKIGVAGACRYCGSTDPKKFRKVAHTFPEALGNKWIESLDECDDCNRIFSRYDDALATGVRPVLTFSAVRGKRNQIPQTGRSDGQSQVRRTVDQNQNRISVQLDGFDVEDVVSVDPGSGTFRFRTPLPPVPFRPRHAFKALCKVGFALLPSDELRQHAKLCKWLLDPADTEDFPMLDVGVSFTVIGIEHPLVAATLLRRIDPQAQAPHTIFIITIGPICFQIDLMSDMHETPFCSTNISWTNVIGNGTGPGHVEVRYGMPIHFNWTFADLEPQPFEAMLLDFNPTTSVGRYVPSIRQSRMNLAAQNATV
jgi:hypothetical protein